MIRLLLATTAVAAVLATGAIAQDASSSAASSAASESTSSSMDMTSSSTEAMSSSAPASAESSATTASSAQATTTTGGGFDILSGYTQADTDHLASKIIGSPVYDGAGTDANNLGKISDIVVNENGQVAAVVIGVGGFLGIGEKQVAVDFGALQFVIAADNTERYVLQTTKDQLTNAPDFKTVEDQPGQASASGANGAASDNGAAAGGATTGTTTTTSSAANDMMASSSAAQ